MAEIDRIIAIPAVDFENHPEDLTRVMTDYLRTTQGAMSLRPWQARALQYASDYGRLFVEAPMGAGKTLVAFLLPVVCDLQRPLLVIPASLRKDTFVKYRAMQEHWKLRPFEVVSYDEFSRDTENELFKRLSPDALIFDEVHMLKNLGCGRGRKFARIFEENPGIKRFMMTGTPVTDSVADVAHIMGWSLGEWSPYPNHSPTLYRWQQATDPDKPEQDRKVAASIAGLHRLPGTEGDTWLDRIRKRVRSTPGVAWVQDLYNGPLRIVSKEYPFSDSCLEVLKGMRETGLRPDGEPIEDGLEMWRHAQELWFGYWGKWDPMPPREWRLARKEWCRFVRESLKEMDTERDTAHAIAKAIDSGDARFAAGHEPLREWRAVKPTFEVNATPEWIDKVPPVFAYARGWLSEHPGGLIWLSHVPAAQQLSGYLGIPYFGAGQGENGAPMVEDHEGPAVLSVDANVLGRNLQYKWHENLVLGPPACGMTLNQLIARCHRPGQTKEVYVEIVSAPGDSALQKAIKDSEFIGRLQGEEQKLIRGLCDKVV